MRSKLDGRGEKGTITGQYPASVEGLGVGKKKKRRKKDGDDDGMDHCQGKIDDSTSSASKKACYKSNKTMDMMIMSILNERG